ncbi:MAG: ThiF family adenylyltransferase [Spirochaetaceae bacterium]|nr:MAG: ThiF family adenylyltransferase [Spirochaetaceae bacterium]
MSKDDDRYARHRPMLSDDGMRRLRSARVLLAGVGGLGSNVAVLLARLGVARLIIRDPGVLDAPDLNRQVLYMAADLGRAKVDVARERLREINPGLELDLAGERISADTRLPRADICFDCLDSFGARAALESALCNGWGDDPAAGGDNGLLSGKHDAGSLPVPLIHGGAEGWFGQVSTLAAGGQGYRGLFGPAFDQRSAEQAQGKPIMPHVVALVAAAQVGEFVRWCQAGTEEMLINRILVLDGLSHQHEIIRLNQQVVS